MRINATSFKNHLGEYMQKVYQEPIIVEKSGKPSAVLISYDTFERLSDLEDFYWGMKAEKASKNGYVGIKESEKRLKGYAEKAGIIIDEQDNNKK
jgi:antitoxin Phd